MSDISKFSPLSGDWYIKELIGRGTYGAVYKAVKEDKQFGKTYISAIKQYKTSGISEQTPEYFIDQIHLNELGAEQGAKAIWNGMKN